MTNIVMNIHKQELVDPDRQVEGDPDRRYNIYTSIYNNTNVHINQQHHVTQHRYTIYNSIDYDIIITMLLLMLSLTLAILIIQIHDYQERAKQDRQVERDQDADGQVEHVALYDLSMQISNRND